MVIFSLLNDKEVWNENIIKDKNFSPYQLFEWGEYKQKSGWNKISIKANNNGDIGYLQITYKIKFNIFFGWCIGSISGKISSFAKEELIKFLQKELKIKYIYLKSSFTNILDFDLSFELYKNGWKKSCVKINSDYSILVDLTKNLDTLVSDFSSNWRKNLKKGKASNKEIKTGYLEDFDIEKIADLFDRFKIIKDIPLPNLNELKMIKKYLSKQIMIAVSILDGHFIGLRAFLFLHNKALDFWATTDEVGRKNYTSFVLLYELFKKAKEMDIKEYDMSGIDPLDNPNVYFFKNGLRASIIEKLGEWEISNSKLLSFIINKVYL